MGNADSLDWHCEISLLWRKFELDTSSLQKKKNGGSIFRHLVNPQIFKWRAVGPRICEGKKNSFFFVVFETLLESPWIWRWPSFKKKNRERREMKVDSLPSNGHFLFGKETKWRFGFRHLIHMVSDDMNFLKQNVFVFLFAVIWIEK